MGRLQSDGDEGRRPLSTGNKAGIRACNRGAATNAQPPIPLTR
jgi:hypothetical protein